MRARGAAAWLAGMLILTLPAAADADERQRSQARRLANRAFHLYQDGEFDQAFSLFEQAQQIYSAPPHLLYMARCMVRLGKLVAGFSGVVVDATDWVTFFLYASTLGIPSILLIAFIWIRGREGMPGYHVGGDKVAVAARPAE